MRLRPIALVAASVAMVSVVSGCGAGNPGLAVEGSGVRVDLANVDQITQSYCSAYEKAQQAQGQTQAIPMSYLRQYVAGQLAQRAVADAVAAQYDVQPTGYYDSWVAQNITAQTETMPEDQADAVVQVFAAEPYLQAVEYAVGAKTLAEQGQPATDPKAQLAAGQKAVTAWVADHPLKADPRLGIGFNGLTAAPVDTSVTVPWSPLARSATDTSATADLKWAADLPADQRCG